MMHYTVLPKRHWILGRSQKQRHSRREAVHTRHSLQHTQQIYSVCYWYICLTGYWGPFWKKNTPSMAQGILILPGGLPRDRDKCMGRLLLVAEMDD